MERYRRFLPITDATPPLTLGEGGTPLVRASRLGAAIGVRRTCTSRSKARTRPARSRTGAWSWPSPRRVEGGARAIVCASTGNTSASAAAYGAAAGLDVIVILPKGQTALGKLLQALVAGARVVAIDGNFDQALAHRPWARRTGRPSGDPGQLGQPVPPRRPADRRVRGLRRPRPGAGRPGHPGRQCRQHQRLLARLHGPTPTAGRHPLDAGDVGLPGGRCGTDRPRPAGRAAGDRGDGHPHRRSGLVGAGRRRPRREPAAGSRP